MSSDNDFIASLLTIQTNLYRFGGPFLISLGTVSCILSLIVFTKKNLRKTPFSIYLIAFNMGNFLLIYTSLLYLTLINGYNIDPSRYNLMFCHFRFYTVLLADVLSPSYIILASIDRLLITSSNALTRQRSTRRFALISVIMVTLFWLLCHIHTLIFTNIIQYESELVVCYFQGGTYLAFIGYYYIIVKGILIPLLMITLGIYTIKNIRNLGRVMPTMRTVANGILRSVHSKDRQLIRILLMDISTYVIFSLMISIVFMYQQINQDKSGDSVYVHTQVFLVGVGIFSSCIPFCIECYTNILISKTFRHEVKKIFMCK